MSEKIVSKLRNEVRKFYLDTFLPTLCLAYALHLVRKHNSERVANLKQFLQECTEVSEDVKALIVRSIGDHWEDFLKLASFFDSESLLATTSRLNPERKYEMGYTSPAGVNQLMFRLLKVESGNTIRDLACGDGSFLVMAQEVAREAGLDLLSVSGVEMSVEIAAAAELKLEATGFNGRVEIQKGDMFHPSFQKGKYDRVACFPPFGVKVKLDTIVQQSVRRDFPTFPEFSTAGAGEWIFAARAVGSMNQGGRAVVLMTSSSFTSKTSEPIRKFFVESELVEAVVKLPERVLEHTNIPIYAVVFSHGNANVRLLDASGFCEKRRNRSELTETSIETICSNLFDVNVNNENVHVLKREDLLASGYDMLPEHFLGVAAELRGAFRLGSALVDVSRGAMLLPEDLERLETNDATSYRYLAPGDISNGEISTNLRYLSKVPEKAGCGIVRDGDLVVSRIGNPYRFAVAELSQGELIVANNNLFVLKVDTEKVDPYYLKAYLESEKGRAILEANSAGVAVKAISVQALKELPIVLPSLDVQRMIGSKMRSIQKESVALCRLRAEVRDEVAAIIDGTVRED